MEKLGRPVEINVVPHRQPPCGAGLVPRPLELVRTPTLDALDLGLFWELKFSRRHGVPFDVVALDVRSDDGCGSPAKG